MDDLRSLAEPRAGVPASVPAPRSDGFSTAGPVRIFFSRFGSGNTIGHWTVIYRLHYLLLIHVGRCSLL